jgi:transcriptional regulator with XRE-family HTH domain
MCDSAHFWCLNMPQFDAIRFGANLSRARKSIGLTQAALAHSANLTRFRVTRMEAGQYLPRLDEIVRLAAALKAPLEWFFSGRWMPTQNLQGIAYELNHLGIRDLEVSEAAIPGSFRYGEEILVLALTGDRPEPRIVEAIPFVLAIREFKPSLTAAFVELHDPRVQTRLAWLSDIALILSRQSGFPAMKKPSQLRAFIQRGQKSEEPDSLGHPSDKPTPPAWRRWNVTYSGTIQGFQARSLELSEALRQSESLPENET